MRNLDGELLVSVTLTDECGHMRIEPLGPARWLDEYRRANVGTNSRCEYCPGRPYKRLISAHICEPDDDEERARRVREIGAVPFERQVQALLLRTDCIWEAPGDYEYPQALEGAAAAMDDDGQAIRTGVPAPEIAYQVNYLLASAPDAGITVWTYPVYGPADMPGTYQVGVRYQLAAVVPAGRSISEWSYDGYTESAEPLFYGDLDGAIEAACEEARLFADATADFQQEYPDIFGWDGEPFPADDTDGG